MGDEAARQVPTAPELPASLPQDLRDFVEFRTSTVTIRNGPQTWIGQANPPPDLTIVPGSTADTMTIKVSLGFISASLPAAIGAGRLSIDTKGLPWLAPQSIAVAINAYVDQLNRWFEANGKGLGMPTFGSGEVTLHLVDVPRAPG